MRTNCLFYAWALWWRRRRRGREGYVAFRQSRMGRWYCHTLYAERRTSGSLRVVSYKPTIPKAKPVPPVVFDGKPRWGD